MRLSEFVPVLDVSYRGVFQSGRQTGCLQDSRIRICAFAPFDGELKYQIDTRSLVSNTAR